MPLSDYFIVWDMTIPGLRPLMELAAERGLSVPGLDPRGGDLTQVVLDGIKDHSRIVVFADRPNANVGYELGYALGHLNKSVALVFSVGAERPEWLRHPPLSGILCHAVREPLDLLNLPDTAFMNGPLWVPQGDDTLLLCPGGVEGATLKYKISRDLQLKCRELHDDGWNITTLPEQLQGVAHVVWIITSHGGAADVRDGSDNARNAVVAGFAEARGVQLSVLASRQARRVVDVESRTLFFDGLQEFVEALRRSTPSLASAARSQRDAQDLPGLIDFAPLINRATQDFVGRGWLTARLDTFLDGNDRGYVRLEALPGLGKTAFAAHLVKARGWVHHFNTRQLGVVSFQAFLTNLRSQLVERHSLKLPVPSTSDYAHGLFLDALLQEAGSQLTSRGERTVIVVDALDEAERGPEGSQPLFLPTSLPSGIRMVVLGRKHPRYQFAADQPLLSIEIDPADPENQNDLRRFLEHAATGALASILVQQQKTAEWFIGAMQGASEGNFMYVRSVVNDILSGSGVIANLNQLPAGLRAYYERHWERIEQEGGKADWPSRLLYPTLCVLSVAAEPLTAEAICAVLRVGFRELPAGEAAVRAALGLWGQFLVQEPAPGGPAYQIYHKSFQEFLHDKPEVSGELARRNAHLWLAVAVQQEFLEGTSS